MPSRSLRKSLSAIFCGPMCAILGGLALVSGATANDDPVWWNAEIAKVEAEADRLFATMRAKGTFVLGTGVNEVDYDIHTCHILSIMLGKDHLTPLLVARPDPPQADDEPGFAEGVEGQSRSNWAELARGFLPEGKVEHIRAWNLDCVGQFGITGQDHVREDDGRALVVVDGEVIRVLGNVEAGFFEELRTAIDANPTVTQVALGSAGGSVGDAVKAGRYIRAKGLNTELYNNCRSACALVYLGGVDRRIGSPYPELGFHRISSGGVAIPDSSNVYGLVHDYAEEMGVEGDFFVSAMMKAGVREMHHPEMDELCAANVATAVQRVCFGAPRQAQPPMAKTGVSSVGRALAPTIPPAEAESNSSVSAGGRRCSDIRAQRQRIVDKDPKIARAVEDGGSDIGGMVAVYDAMLREYGCQG